MARRLASAWSELGGPFPSEDQLQTERFLAAARLFLVTVALVAVNLDPDEGTLLVGTARRLLAAYLIFAIAVLVLLRGRAQLVLRWRGIVHAVDVAAASIITGLTQSTSTPLIFVLLGAALRWGSGPTVVTGVVTMAWYLAHGLLNTRLASEVELTPFLMRAAYLLIATIMLTYLAGRQSRFYAETRTITHLLSRARRTDRFAQTLHAVLDQCLTYSGARSGLLALEDEEAARLYIWRVRSEGPASPSALSLTEESISNRERFFASMPEEAAVWYVARRHRETPRARLLTFNENVPGVRVDAAPHAPLLDREGVDRCIVVRANVPGWKVRAYSFNPTQTDDASLRFLLRLTALLGPVLQSQFLATKLRSKIGEVERARMARELHDGLIQSLLSIELRLGALRRRAATTGTLVDELQDIQQELHRSILDTRDLMGELRPVVIHRDGLVAEISGIVDRFRTDSGTAAHFVSDVDEIDSAPRTSIEISRIVREALINVRKHAQAHHVTVRLSRGASGWALVIDDDGRGFEFKGRWSQEELDRDRRGPVVIKERLRSIGGTLTIDSEPQRGSRLEVSWPFGRRYVEADVESRPVGSIR